jgi:hypothetical protein
MVRRQAGAQNPEQGDQAGGGSAAERTGESHGGMMPGYSSQVKNTPARRQ